jgi:hypothetical protein
MVIAVDSAGTTPIFDHAVSAALAGPSGPRQFDESSLRRVTKR